MVNRLIMTHEQGLPRDYIPPCCLTSTKISRILYPSSISALTRSGVRPQQRFEMDFSQLSLAAACALTGYLTVLAFTPPNPNPETPDVHDRWRRLLTPNYLKGRWILCLALTIYHGVLVLILPPAAKATTTTTTTTSSTMPALPSPLCPYPSNLNVPLLFTWSTYTASLLAAVCLIGAPLRLAAYRTLGINFTFHLQKPSTLTTTGMYRYVQHPSYTGQVLVVAANSALFWRWDGALGCWISPEWLARLSGWGLVVFAFPATLVCMGIRGRVLDEEKMLKEKFGQEWVRWHERTKRFVPGVV